MNDKILEIILNEADEKIRNELAGDGIEIDETQIIINQPRWSDITMKVHRKTFTLSFKLF